LVAFIMYSVLLEKNRSPQICGYGLHTSVLQKDPVDTCPFIEAAREEKHAGIVKIHPPKTFTLGLFPHGGCVALAMKGGGPDGYTVARVDLTRSPGDDGSTVEMFGIPVKFRSGGGAGFLDLNDLPPKVQAMLRAHENWVESAPVNFMVDPIRGFELDDLNKNATLDWEMMYYSIYGQLNNKDKENSNLMSANTRYSSIHEATLRATKRDIDGPKEGLFERLTNKESQQ
jgi:hypothetical protein